MRRHVEGTRNPDGMPVAKIKIWYRSAMNSLHGVALRPFRHVFSTMSGQRRPRVPKHHPKDWIAPVPKPSETIAIRFLLPPMGLAVFDPRELSDRPERRQLRPARPKSAGERAQEHESRHMVAIARRGRPPGISAGRMRSRLQSRPPRPRPMRMKVSAEGAWSRSRRRDVRSAVNADTRGVLRRADELDPGGFEGRLERCEVGCRSVRFSELVFCASDRADAHPTSLS